ncbi:MAG: hypothetical protein ACK54T_10410 [bacterium]
MQRFASRFVGVSLASGLFAVVACAGVASGAPGMVYLGRLGGASSVGEGISAIESAITGYGMFNGQTYSGLLKMGIPGPSGAARLGLGGVLTGRRRA